ncbi:MAG: hypothetical protein U1C53_02555, partial [Candidatus Veblenbacteria bacterium]|nr:hypothetical protein [Candidatus Veblenbacteria bacterium]
MVGFLYMNRTRWHVFAREYVVSLFPVSHLVDCLGFSIKRVLGQNAGEFGCKLEDHAVWWLVTDGWGSLHRRLVRRIERNPKWFPLMLRRIEQHGRGLVETARHLGGGDLTKLSSSELNRRYLKFREHNLRLYDIALLCSLLDYQSDTYLSDAVNAVLVPRVAKERVAQYFTTLTTPLRRSLDQVQEEHLLGLYAELRRFPTLLKALSSVTRSNFLDLVRKRDPKWHKHFLSHVKNFAAWPYVYEGPAADEDYFIELLRDFRRRRVNPQATLRRRQLQLKELAD